MATGSLQAFLATARNALTRGPSSSSPLTFVVGNESADVDSLCSAIVYAFVRTRQEQQQQQQQQQQEQHGALHIPLSNLPRDDLALRTEMTYVLRHAAGLTPDDLITLTDLPSHLTPRNTRWVLVDHNALTGPLARFSAQVTGCVDHHVDEGVVPAHASPRLIEPCGSCASLIVTTARQRDAWPPDLAKLALAPVLIDTNNLTASSKVRPKDTSAVAFLLSQLPPLPPFDATAYYNDIQRVKEDLSGLSVRDILRKDYKQWDERHGRLGVSCAVQNLEYLVSRADGAAGFLREVASWARERQLDVAAVMTTSHGGGPGRDEFRRELLVWGLSERGAGAMRAFDRLARGTLRLERWKRGELDERDTRCAWAQRDLAASRKQVAPLLREAMGESGGA